MMKMQKTLTTKCFTLILELLMNGLKAIPMAADTGPIGGDLSHEFIILAEAGESQIYADKKIFEIDFEKYDITSKSLKK